jgi:hypothetical protein
MFLKLTVEWTLNEAAESEWFNSSPSRAARLFPFAIDDRSFLFGTAGGVSHVLLRGS